MRCGYCGQFMALVDLGPEWGTDWKCSQDRRHALSDPEHWTVADLDALGCEWVRPDVGHEDEGYSCATHNMPWGECLRIASERAS